MCWVVVAGGAGRAGRLAARRAGRRAARHMGIARSLTRTGLTRLRHTPRLHSRTNDRLLPVSVPLFVLLRLCHGPVWEHLVVTRPVRWSAPLRPGGHRNQCLCDYNSIMVVAFTMTHTVGFLIKNLTRIIASL